MKIALFFGALLTFSVFSGKGQVKKPATGKEPDWVKIQSVNYTETSLDNEAEDGYIDLIYDRQVNVEQTAVYFRKAVRKLLIKFNIS